jgi:hypothetical protein
LSAIVFVGPTLRTDEVRRLLDAECRPPVKQGDVYSAALRMPRYIGVIDGYFEGVPSVWHKEILWAMAKGIQVFGSASMGALRAAELADFGMKGVGQIFEDYRSGRLTDDDEVAVLHAPAELGFTTLSEPMVSVRATIEHAEAEGVLEGDMTQALLNLAKAMHYRARSWDAILLAAEGKTGRIDAKRSDAIAMLKAMAAAMETGEAAAPVDYSFERTHVWQGLTERIEAQNLGLNETALSVLDELRLDRESYQRLRDRAALRSLALEAARRRGTAVDRKALIEEMSRHRSRNRLLKRRELGEWLESNDLDERDYEALLGESRLIEAGAAQPPGSHTRHLLAELKWAGEFALLKHRAIDKARVLDAVGPAAGVPSPAGHLKSVLWYFEERLGQVVPDDLDDYARSLGLEGREELYRILEREYLYCKSVQDAQERDRRD